MTEEQINNWKQECSQKFNNRYEYPDNNEFGKYKEDSIRIYDTIDKDFFYQSPANHKKSNTGKPRGKSSLEESVKTMLVQNNIPFEAEYVLNEWKNSPVDFVIGSIAVECQGIQHIIPLEKFGGISKTELQIANDRKKACLLANTGYTVVYLSEYSYPEELRADFIKYFTTDEIEGFKTFIIDNYSAPMSIQSNIYTTEACFKPIDSFQNFSNETVSSVIDLFKNTRYSCKKIALELGLTDKDVTLILTSNGIDTEQIKYKKTILSACPIFAIDAETGVLDMAFASVSDANKHEKRIGNCHIKEYNHSVLSRRVNEPHMTLYGHYWRAVSSADPEQLVIIKNFIMKSYGPQIYAWMFSER